MMASPATVQAQETVINETDLTVLLNRLDSLERNVRTLHVAVANGTPIPKDASPKPSNETAGASTEAIARFYEHLSSIEDDIKSLTNIVETVRFEGRKTANDWNAFKTDVAFRLEEMEKSIRTRPVNSDGGGGVARNAQGTPTATTALQGATDTTAPQDITRESTTPATTETPVETIYQQAFKTLESGQYEEASQQFQAFYEAYPTHALSSNAYYWQGETYYVRGEYPRAAQIFLQAYRKFPTAGKAPDSLLKLGMSLVQIDKASEACTVFNKLEQEFSRLSAHIQNEITRQKQAIACS